MPELEFRSSAFLSGSLFSSNLSRTGRSELVHGALCPFNHFENIDGLLWRRSRFDGSFGRGSRGLYHTGQLVQFRRMNFHRLRIGTVAEHELDGPLRTGELHSL